MQAPLTQSVNLFVYGSLREPSIFESVCGYTFTLKSAEDLPWNVLRAELAILPNYRRVSPDNVYYYAVPDPANKIQGFVIYDVPPSAMAMIDKYEGKLYERETVKVHTANGVVEAQAYLASPKTMKKRFGDRFRVNLIHELWLRKRIERFFDKHTRPGEHTLDAHIERLARRELVGTTERDLILSQLGQEMVSDYFLEHELSRATPSILTLFKDADALPYVENYLALVIKQTLLNHLETLILDQFRFELEQLQPNPRYYKHALSLLLALRMANGNAPTVDMVLRRGLETLPPTGKYDLIDYVKYAILAAENLFDARVVQSDLQMIRTNFQPGLVPMGAEIELSNLGARAVDPTNAHQDPLFDSFRYFHAFALDILSWRLGGHIDDHSGEFEPGRRGFLELAPGRLTALGEVSKPASADPWVMNQLINHITQFYPVNPHSLHLSFQLRRTQVGRHNHLPVGFVKCLLILGGGTQLTPSGHICISRLANREIQRIVDGREELMFCRICKKQYRIQPDPDSPPTVVSPATICQFKFIRLEPRANYEPLMMALKGLQIALNPGDYLTSQQLAKSRTLQREYQELTEWAQQPEPISTRTKRQFLDTIRDGLMHEAHHRPYHKQHYIEWALDAIDLQIRMFNKQLQEHPVPKTG